MLRFRFILWPLCYLVANLLFAGSWLEAKEDPATQSSRNERELKNHFWSVSLSGERYSFKAGDGFEFMGNSGLVSLGYGYLDRRWFVTGMADMIIGPFNPAHNPELDIDYQGTGAKLWWGYSAQELDLRHPDGGYGFLLGLSYEDFAGRSIGSSRNKPSDPFSLENLGLRSRYSQRVLNMSLMPGIFFCWLEPARFAGSSPSELITRIEGYLLSIAFSVPLVASYKSTFLERELKAELQHVPLDELSETREGRFWHDKQKAEKGRLKGFTILVSLSALLGA